VDSEAHRSLFVSLPFGLAFLKVATDEADLPEDYVLVDMNDAFEHLTRLSRDEVLGRSLAFLVARIGGDHATWREKLDRVAISGGQERFDCLTRRPVRWCEVTVLSPATGHLALVLEDASTSRSVAGGPEAGDQNAVREGMMMTVSRIAHDFNNILATIIGLAEVILYDMPEKDRTRPDVLRIKSAAERAAGLAKQIHGLSRGRPLDGESEKANSLP
jgi:signal transduction histidine kinase